jgi:hypothetical protein
MHRPLDNPLFSRFAEIGRKFPMKVPLHWRASPRASGFHAAAAVRRGWALVDGGLAAALLEPVRQIEAELAAADLSAERFWDEAAPRSASDDDLDRLIEDALRAAGGGERLERGLIRRMTELIASLEKEFNGFWPRLDEELRLRERPLREQWESRGPGMLGRLNELTGGELTIPEASVALVAPCLGGGGEAHPPFRLVRLEAVLANPWTMLPEPVRLGWLLAQLGVGKDNDPNGEIAALALVSLAVEAAEYVEWCAASPATLELALTAWRPKLPPRIDAAHLAGALAAWSNDHELASRSWRDRVNDLAARLSF